MLLVVPIKAFEDVFLQCTKIVLMWDFIYLYLKFLVTSSKASSVLTPGLKEKLPELQPVPAWDVSIAGGSCAHYTTRPASGGDFFQRFHLDSVHLYFSLYLITFQSHLI